MITALFCLSEPTIRRSLLLRVAVLVFVSIALFACGLYVLIIRPTVQDLAAREMRSAVASMQGRITQKVAQVEYVLQVARAWGENGQLDLDDPKRFNQRFMPLVRHSPVISSAILADNNGREMVLLQLADGTWANRITDVARQGKKVRWMVWQDEQTLLSDEYLERDYDPRRRLWHQGALAMARDDDLYWTAPYRFFTRQEPGITLASRWRRGGQTYVVGFDVALADLSRFTSSLVVGEGGHAAILTGDGALLALPRHPNYSDEAAVRQALLQPASTSTLTELRLAAAHWEENGRRAFFATLGEEQWVTSVQPQRLHNQQLWLVAQAPLQDFIPGALRDALLLGLLLLLALLIGIVMAARLARRVSTPLEILAADSERIGAMDFSPHQYRRTGWQEIDRLSAAQDHMRETLQDATQRLEERVAQRTGELAQAREEVAHQLLLLQATVESIPNPLFVKDPQGRFTGCNRAYEECFGVRRQDLIGRSILEIDFLPEADRQHLHQISKRVIGESLVVHQEISLPFGDGQRHNLLYWANGFRDDSGAPGGMVGVLVDISERKQMEEELRRARGAAEQATEAKSLFLANMSHEIRTPMNAVIGMAHLAMKTELTPKQRDYLGKIHNAAVSLLGIINDILDFSKIEAGKLSLEEISFSLEDVLDNVSTLLGLKATDKGLELLFDVGADIPNGLLGDPLRLNQVLTNLVSNAVKFTDQGQITLSVRAVEQAGDRVKLQFQVIDSGIGMTPEESQRLFQAFTQADGSTTRKYGGTGLGLSISRRLVELMGGTIWADSVPGEGSAFSFTAWFGQAAEQARRRTLPASLAGLRVLVADDNGAAREILGEALRHLELRPDLVASGPEALAQLAVRQGGGEPYRVLFLDWQMPGLDGVGTLRQLQQLLPPEQRPRVVMVTAYDQEELRRQTADLGIAGILVKPVNASTLFDALVGLVDSDSTMAAPLPLAAAETRLDGLRVLLAEDNEINQQIAVELLQSMGARVTVADDGLQAVQYLEGAPDDFDLVLMDLQMPHLDGYSATEHLRRQPRFAQLPILAMTAHAMPEERARCLDIGMNDHLAKPIDPTALAAALSRWRPQNSTTAAAPLPPPAVLERPGEELEPIDGIDTRQGLARTAGNSKLYRSLLRQFIDNHGSCGSRIAAALAAADRDQARLLAHSLKGVSGNIGAEALQQRAAALEQALEQALDGEADEAALAALQQALAGELQRVTEAIASGIHGPTATPVSPPQLDEAQRLAAREELARLAAALEGGDIQAARLFQEGHTLLAGLLPPGDLQRLARAMDNYDFDGALGVLRAHL